MTPLTENTLLLWGGGDDGGSLRQGRWEKDTEENCMRKWKFVSIIDIQSSQMSCQSSGECLIEQKVQHIVCLGVTFDLNGHH